MKTTISMLRSLLTNLLFGALLVVAPVQAADPGTDTDGIGPSAVTLGSIVPLVTETGFISLSVDGLGTNNLSGIIQVEKPAGASVRSAFMAAASTGFTNRVLADGDVTIDSIGVVWNIIPSTPSSISSFNSLADVTALVKPKIDAAPAGLVDFSISEVNTGGIDGEVLVVIFDDPNQTTNNTIVLLFGAQDISGDTFAIGLAAPIDKSDPNLALDLSLGISFGFQPSDQVSLVDVNGVRMTSAAGGQDDGVTANGALLTAGGVGDTNGNPPPFSSPVTPSDPDDELYNLLPFVNDGDTNIIVFTTNPSNDDNIFFASLFLASTTAIVGEGILLSPVSATNDVGTQHTLTAKIQDDEGNPVEGRSVTIEVISGPNAGVSGTGSTDVNGEFSFNYAGLGGPGVDEIQASFVGSQGNTQVSNPATKEWVSVVVDQTPPTCELVSINPGPPTSIEVFTQDLESGLDTISALVANNATVVIPGFSQGTNDPVIVTATKIDQSQSAQVALEVTDVAGNVTACDPVTTLVIREKGKPETQTYENIPEFESTVTVINGESGVKNLDVIVNGQKFKVTALGDGEQTVLNVSSAMVEGNNTITLTGYGKPGSSATVVISD